MILTARTARIAPRELKGVSLMRVAAIYDIHGNLPALEAVLQEIRQAEIDHVVVGGDVLPGPMPGETLAYLLDLEIPVQYIFGNGEVAVLEQMAGKEPTAVPEPYRPIIRWTAKQLNPEHERLLSAWHKTLRVEIDGLGMVLFCHATPRNENECFTRLTPEEPLLQIFDGLDAPLVVCGHTHMQFDRMIGATRVINAGSVGMPFGEPGADWLLLGPDVQLRHTPYDLTEAAERIRGTNYPQALDFAAQNVLQPPSETDMLEVFTRVELR
jgi:predicted phosphodiesterase